jgi:hypothetical protein
MRNVEIEGIIYGLRIAKALAEGRLNLFLSEKTRDRDDKLRKSAKVGVFRYYIMLLDRAIENYKGE